MNRESIQKLHNIHQAAASAIRDNDIELVKYISAAVNDILREEAQPDPDLGLTSDEVQMLKAGDFTNRINAIKSVRIRKGGHGPNGFFGLKEAKELVEAAGDRLGLRVDGRWR